MEAKGILILVLLGIAFGNVEPAANASCNSQWQGYNRCMKNQLAKSKDANTGLPKPSNSVATNLQISNIRACFKESNCKDPLAPEASSRARGLCFPTALKGLRDELQACVKKNLSNFALPEDEFSAASGSNDVLFLLASTAMKNVGKYCSSNINAQTISSCVAKKWSTSGFTTTAPTDVSYCDTIRQCKSVSFITDNCFTAWNDLMCPCTQSMRFLGTVTKYENQYIDCMKRVGVTVNKNDETPLTWLDTSIKGMCDSSSSTRGTTSWAPGNRFCDIATTTTRKVVTTARPTTTTTTEEPTQPSEEEETTTPYQEEETTPGQSEDETTPYEDSAQDTTRRTYFFEQFTFETEGEPEPTTTQVPATTKKGNWLQDYLGIQNPMDGAWGDILNPGKWFGQEK